MNEQEKNDLIERANKLLLNGNTTPIPVRLDTLDDEGRRQTVNCRFISLGAIVGIGETEETIRYDVFGNVRSDAGEVIPIALIRIVEFLEANQ